VNHLIDGKSVCHDQRSADRQSASGIHDALAVDRAQRPLRHVVYLRYLLPGRPRSGRSLLHLGHDDRHLHAWYSRPGGHGEFGYGTLLNQDCCTASEYDNLQWQFRSVTDLNTTRDLQTTTLTPHETYTADHQSWHHLLPDVLVPVISATYRYQDGPGGQNNVVLVTSNWGRMLGFDPQQSIPNGETGDRQDVFLLRLPE
jgi:hypothetical protein